MSRTLTTPYIGPLAGLTPPRVSAAPGTDTLAARELLDPARLAALFDRFGTQSQYGHGDRRAVASLWSKWHFSGLCAQGGCPWRAPAWSCCWWPCSPPVPPW